MSAQLKQDVGDQVREFLRVVSDTGRPQDWPLLAKGKPPRDLDFQIWKFVIPLKLRASVPMVHCAVCRPNGPKYWVGYLVRFNKAGSYYVVGHDCGSDWLGAEFAEQASTIDIDEADERAEAFLVDNINVLSVLRSC